MLAQLSTFASSTTALHAQEWQESAVSPSIVKLNVRSLEGNQAYEYLLYGLGDSERTNTGKLREKWLKRYSHLDHGGWWCSGVDVLTGQPSDWGCFKPDRPQLHSETLKPIKYEHPAKTATELFALRLTWQDGLKIAKKQGFETEYLARMGVNLPEAQDYGFWQWVIETPSLHICITEGAKKAGSLMTAGHIAIGLPGIYSGYRQLRDKEGKPLGLPHLIPQLAVFAVKGRELTFYYDQDTKSSTIRSVCDAIRKTGKILKSKGCKVSVSSWPNQWKGIDDLIADEGENAADRVFEKRVSLGQFNAENDGRLTPSLILNEKYTPESLDIPEDKQLIAIKAPKGTGKTEWIANKIAPHLAKGGRVLNLTHRVQLGRESSNRLGIPYRTELASCEEGSLFGYTLCVDSLHDKANPRFIPSEWEGAIIVIDEVEQVLWHLLNSPTCEQRRVKILESFRILLQTVLSTGGKIFVADADLTQNPIYYIQQLTGYPVPAFIIENTYQSPTKRELYVYDGIDPCNLIQEVEISLISEQKILLMTDGQKHKSKWGTRNLEFYLKKQFPHLRIVRVDAESVADKTHPAYGCMGNFNEFVKDWDMVICSPVIETGISIDCNHFDAVFAISHRVQTDNAFAQALARVRTDIPRYIWRKKTSPNRLGNGGTDPLQVLAGESFKHKSTISVLSYLGVREMLEFSYLEDDNSHPPSLWLWAKYAAKFNCEAIADESYFLDKMEKEGYEIKPINSPDRELLKGVRDEVRVAKRDNYSEHIKAVLKAEGLTDAQYKTFKEKRELTEGERNQYKRERIKRTYGVNLTEELITKDDDGWYPQIRLHYFLTVGKESLADHDCEKIDKAIKEGGGKLFLPDENRKTLARKVELLRRLGVERFLDPEKEFTGEALSEWIEQLKNPILIAQIKTILGFTLSMKDSAISFAQRLLGAMGLKLQGLGRRRGDDGRQRRIYKGCDPLADGRGEVFDVWLKRLQEFSEMDAMAA